MAERLDRQAGFEWEEMMPEPTMVLGPAAKAIGHGLPWIRAKLAGKTVVVIGPPAAGKSTLLNFIRYARVMEPERHTPTERWEKGQSFSIQLGRDQRCYTRAAIDSPGQVIGAEHAYDAVNRRPHALLIVLDIQDPDGAARWLTEFIGRYSLEWTSKSPRRKRRLRLVMVVINKIDLVNEQSIERCEERFDRIMAQNFERAAFPRLNKVLIRRCVAVRKSGYSLRLLEQVVHDLAVNLQ